MTTLGCMSSTMSGPHYSFGPDHVAEKVLRRVEIAKVARSLQDCLAFASFKAQNGWENRTLRTIEPEVTEQLKRKRPHSSDDIMSDSSSEDEVQHHNAPFLSNSSFGRPQSHAGQANFKAPEHPNKRVRSMSTAEEGPVLSGMSWKQNHNLPQSSPAFQRTHTSLSSSHVLFMSEATAVPNSQPENSPMFDISHTTQDDDEDLPMHAFRHPSSSSIISSSPPRTPPPTRHSRNTNTKQDGADLLLYLANSPSRSPGPRNPPASSEEAPLTPPSQHSHLPSSVMNTPGVGLFLQTPGQNFNFADFVNVTPSPAQLSWGGRTPGMSKTPGATRLARRSLNFDTLAPPTGGSRMQQEMPTSQGLALELGGELMPRL